MKYELDVQESNTVETKAQPASTYAGVKDLLQSRGMDPNTDPNKLPGYIFDYPEYVMVSDIDVKLFNVKFRAGQPKTMSGLLAEKCELAGKGHIKRYVNVQKKKSEIDAIKQLIKEELAASEELPEDSVEKVTEVIEEEPKPVKPISRSRKKTTKNKE